MRAISPVWLSVAIGAAALPSTTHAYCVSSAPNGVLEAGEEMRRRQHQ